MNRREFLGQAGAAGFAGLAAGGANAAAAPASMDVAAYVAAVRAEQGLISFWPMEGEISDLLGAWSPEGELPAAAFAEDPPGNQALDLSGEKYVVLGPVPHLDVNETAVEFLFKITAPPPGGHNPCLLAVRDDRKTRFSIHLAANLDSLAVWNGAGVRWSAMPEGAPFEVGRWHHCAITSSAAGDFAVFIDGARCHSSGFGGFNFPQQDLPLVLGAATPEGNEQASCLIDNLAFYGRVINAEEVASHVDALGWRERRLAMMTAQERVIREHEQAVAAAKARHDEKRREMLNDPKVFERGAPRVYEGEHLGAISLPVGGIGAGLIQMDGHAAPHIWQIFGNYEGIRVPHSFFAIRAAAEGSEPVVRALQTEAIDGFEPMARLSFEGRYPFGWYSFEDDALPASAKLEVFSPLIPMNERDSGMPCAIFNFTVRNTSREAVEVSLLGSQQNAAGCDVAEAIADNSNKGYGGNCNKLVDEEQFSALFMSRQGKAARKTCCGPGASNLALSAVQHNGQAQDISGTAGWRESEALLATFRTEGRLNGPREAGPSEAGDSWNGALCQRFTLQPGEERTATFMLSWFFPCNDPHRWEGEGVMYANWWRDSLDVARDAAQRTDSLTSQTRRYVETLYETNLPYWLVDRISSQVAVLRSKTCFWGKDGYFGGWEGCSPEVGCCAGNCSHVWHYAQSHARLFPGIARRMREEQFQFQNEDGSLRFRQVEEWHKIAIDAHCGEILGCYREYLNGAGLNWLQAQWPNIKAAINFTIEHWDPDEDGMLSGAQHHTLDCESGGTASWLGGLYLAALQAAARMAELSGDAGAQKRCMAIYEKGARQQNKKLWNGAYYIQLPGDKPLYDYNNGCSIDQVLGEWWAFQVGVEHSYPRERVRAALEALFQHNFRPDFHGIEQAPRKFVADDDAGMQMITWPEGNRPTPHTLYADEVMSGFEYAAAANMIHYGLLREGFAALKAIADRYDGRRREGLSAQATASWGYSGNPFGDDECGKFYARAMSVWSVLLAAQGFSYYADAASIGFAPVWRPEGHRSFFTTAEGWGLYAQEQSEEAQSCRLEMRYGNLALSRFTAALPQGFSVDRVEAVLGGEKIDAAHEQQGQALDVKLSRQIMLRDGDILDFQISRRA